VIANLTLRLHTDAMPRKFIKRFMPDHQKIRDQKCLRFLGTCLHNPSLWNLNRHSVAGAFFLGMICAFIPIPFQMVLAAVLAVMFQVNIPIAVALVWLTNPLTMAPLFYFAFEVGEWILGQPDTDSFVFEPSLEWMLNLLENNWQPFILGCLVTGVVLGLVGYFAVHVLWRSHVSYRWRNRPGRIAGKKSDSKTPATKQGSSSHFQSLPVSAKSISAAADVSTVSNPRSDSIHL